MNPEVVTLSVQAIAKLAGVTTAAVSNWRRRHADFPAPVSGSASPEFVSEEVTQWLAARRKPSGFSKLRDIRELANEDPFADESRIERVLSEIADAYHGADPDLVSDIILTTLYLVANSDRGRAFASAVRAGDGPAVAETLSAEWPRQDLPLWVSEMAAEDAAADALRNALRLSADRLGEVVAAAVRRGGRAAVARVFSIAIRWCLSRAGNRGGEYGTPESLVDVMVAVLQPRRGDSVFDPCCKSGDLLAGVADAIRVPLEGIGDGRLAGQAAGSRVWRIADMNLSLRGARKALGEGPEDFLRADMFVRESFDVVLSNPPFNHRWTSETVADRSRWQYAIPPASNANFAWVQRIVAKLRDGGRAGVLLPNNASSSASPAEQETRLGLLRDDFIDCLVALPGQLFPSTGIPVTLWVFRRANRRRPGEVLFMDASELGELKERRIRVLRRGDIDRVSATYRTWLAGAHQDVDGFATTVSVTELIDSGGDLNPRAHVRPRRRTAETDPDASTIARQFAHLQSLEQRAQDLDADIARVVARLQWKR